MFLWHFPYGCPRLPLTTVIILRCPDFPLTFKGKRSSSELSKGYYTLGKSFLLVMLVERLVDHAVSELIKLPADVCEGDFIKLGH